jgi:hypothetical protein
VVRLGEDRREVRRNTFDPCSLEALAVLLVKARVARGWTQRDLAECLAAFVAATPMNGSAFQRTATDSENEPTCGNALSRIATDVSKRSF